MGGDFQAFFRGRGQGEECRPQYTEESDGDVIHLFWSHYGCTPETFYRLPIWRVLRQLKAISIAETEAELKLSQATRAAQAPQKDYRKYVNSLTRIANRSKPKALIADEKTVRDLGLEFKKNA